MATLQPPVLRTVDVARGAGYSVQQVRDLERDGVLPAATRTTAGHRIYGEVHVRSASAYRKLAEAMGPVQAKRIVRTVHERPLSEALALLDAAHARLDAERGKLRHARQAVAAIAAEPVEDVRASDAMGVTELAEALGVRPSTLRHWDAQGLVVPDRVSSRGVRRYTPFQVREARIVHQLRTAGYRVDALRELMPYLRRGHRTADVRAALEARDEDVTVRSRALLDAAAALGDVIALSESGTGGRARPLGSR